MRPRVLRLLLAGVAAAAASCAGHVALPTPSSPAVNGRCGGEAGACLLGVPATTGEAGAEYGWQCVGVNGGASAECSVALSPVSSQNVGVEASDRGQVVPGPAAPSLSNTDLGHRSGARGEPPAAVARRRITDLLAAKARRKPAQRKVGSQLLELAAAQASHGSRQPPFQSAELPGEWVSEDGRAEDGRVLVDIRADVTPAVLARIRELDGAVIDSVPGYRAVRAVLPIASVARLAALDAVRSIRPAHEAWTGGRLHRCHSRPRARRIRP